MSAEHRDPPLLVFGATGATGVEIVRQAVGLGRVVNAFARDSHKATEKFASLGKRVRIVAGDALDPASVTAAFADTPAAVILSLGMYQPRAGGDTLTRATGNIIDAMRAHDVCRVINVSSLGVGDSYQQGNFMARLVQRTTLKHTLADKELQEQLLRKSGLDVTNVRPTRLTNRGGPENWHAWKGPQPNRKLVWAIRRAAVAEFALQCLDNPDSIGESYTITGCRD